MSRGLGDVYKRQGIFDIYDENMNRIKSINHHQDVMVFGESAY